MKVTRLWSSKGTTGPGTSDSAAQGKARRQGSRAAQWIACTVALGFASLGSNSAASAKNGAVEFAKYFNPVQKKGYLNESQDRIIKKRSFKSGDIPNVETASNKESGIFAILAPDQISNDSQIEELLGQNYINGLSVTLPWQQLEPTEDEFNWQPVDHLLELLTKHNKSLILRVSTCGLDLPASTASAAGVAPASDDKTGSPADSDTPKWVFDSDVKSITYTGVDGKAHRMPIFWDANYLANWRNFVKALGKRYDKNPALHSVGITGGGVLGGTAVLPTLARTAAGAGSDEPKPDNVSTREIEQKLKKEFGMNQRQIVEHWKYVSDIFPKSFETARLNFDIDPPTPGRAGQDALDEISDYLIYRYGERVYLTRQNVSNAKHGFDQYRLFLKFRGDTLTGYQFTSDISPEALTKVTQSALDDGISYAEVPASLLLSKDESLTGPVKFLSSHIGYEIVTQKAALPAEMISGEPLKASFTFMNAGAAAPLRPSRNFDKDVASSYRIMVELRDATGKPVVLSLHTPPTPTTQWLAGKPVTYDQELKMPKLAPGEYSIFMWLVDSDSQRKLQILDAISQEKPTPSYSIPLGKVKVVPESSAIGAKDSTPH
jgi:hypothetical protein